MPSFTSFVIVAFALVHGVSSLHVGRFDRNLVIRGPQPVVITPTALVPRQQDGGVPASPEAPVKSSQVEQVPSSAKASPPPTPTSIDAESASSSSTVTRSRIITRTRGAFSRPPRTSSTAVLPTVTVASPGSKPTNAVTGPGSNPVIVPPESNPVTDNNQSSPSPIENEPVFNNPSNVSNEAPSDNASLPPSDSSSSPVEVNGAIAAPSPSSSSKAVLPIFQGAASQDPIQSETSSGAGPSATGETVSQDPSGPSGNLGSNKPNMPMIIGAAIAGTVVAILIVAGILLWCRRIRRKESSDFRDLMWRRQSANLFFSAVTTPSMEAKDPESLSTSKIPAYPFHEKYSGYGSSDVGEPVSIPPTQVYSPKHPTPLYQSFVSPPPVMVTPPSPTELTDRSLPTETPRQIELRRQIAKLNETLSEMDREVRAAGGPQVKAMEERLLFLQSLMHCPWALGQTAVVPDGVYL